jgi:hypothetical protein
MHQMSHMKLHAPGRSDPRRRAHASVDTSGISDHNFRSRLTATMGRAAFCVAASAMIVVTARGDRSGSDITWSELELERD